MAGLAGTVMAADLDPVSAKSPKASGTSTLPPSWGQWVILPKVIDHCSPGDTTTQPLKVFVLHIPKSILKDLAKGRKINCAATPTKYCVTTAGPTKDANGDYNGDDGNLQAALPNASNGSTINYATPLDIDLDPYPKSQPNMYWGPNAGPKGPPILIEIELDDPTWKFLTPKTGSGDLSSAVMQGEEGAGMFRCVGPGASGSPLPTVTVRVFKTAQPSYGGLNIGILVPSPKGSPPSFFPLFIDPQIHNNG